MSVKGNKILVCFFAFWFVCSSCSNQNKTDIYVKNNFTNYHSTYKIIVDSVNIYVASLLKEYGHIYNQKWEIDSLLCINSTNNKLVTTINNSSGVGKFGVSDEVTKLLGKKINGKWYFFEGGGTLVVPRDLYGKDEMHPLSMHELSQIARKEFLQGALIKNENGDYVVSDKWVDKHFYNNGFYTFGKHRNPGMISDGEEYQMPRDKEKFDSVHWHFILDKWKHKIDTAEYKKQKESAL